MYRMLAIILLASLLAAHAAAKERTWTDANGRQMKAEFVREVDGVVTFLKDGMLVTFPLEKLSQSDQQIIRDLAMGKALPEDDAPAPVPVTPSTATETTPPAAAKSDSKPASAAKIAIETRTWTDERGNKTNARFVRINGIDVVLNRAGKILTVSYYTLSEDDQQYVRDVLTQQGKESQIPPERTAATNSDSATAPGGVGSSPVASGFPPGGAPLGGGTGPGRIGGAGPGGIGRGMGPPGMGGGIPRPGGMAGGGMPGMPGGGIPGAGMPGGGIGGGMPGGPGMPGGAGGLPGGGIPTGIPTGIPGSGGAMPGGMPGGIAGSGPSGGGLPGGLPGGAMPGGTMGGMPGGGQPTGIGSGRMGGSGMSAGPGVPDFPSMGSIPAPTMPGSGFSSVPTFKQVYQCSGCKREISESQSSLTKCPYCGTYWVYKDDGSGNKKFNGMAGARSVVGVVVAVIAVIVLGAVGGFIGIIVAIVRAVSRPARRANYR